MWRCGVLVVGACVGCELPDLAAVELERFDTWSATVCAREQARDMLVDGTHPLAHRDDLCVAPSIDELDPRINTFDVHCEVDWTSPEGDTWPVPACPKWDNGEPIAPAHGEVCADVRRAPISGTGPCGGPRIRRLVVSFSDDRPRGCFEVTCEAEMTRLE